jgi:CheY-like chemotaxis protein
LFAKNHARTSQALDGVGKLHKSAIFVHAIPKSTRLFLPMSSPHFAQKPRHVLLADDDEDDRFLTYEAFRQHFPGLDMAFVDDGESLLDYLLHNGPYAETRPPLPSLILLDLNMPRKDGREALRQIKANSRLRHIPIIILTTSDAGPDIEQSYQDGANSFITKPTSFKRLSDVCYAIGQYWFNVVTAKGND